MPISTLAAVVQASRPPFLVLTPVCVLLGLALVPDFTSHWPVALAIFCTALCAHLSVNLLNEYQDFRTGLDLHTQRTSFSGGSGALPSQPEAAGAVLVAGVVTLLATIVVGLVLVSMRGLALLPVGVCGVLLVVLYTGWINRVPWLCLIAPGLGFGPLMVIGTAQVMAPAQLDVALWASVLPFCLVNNLLLLNQYPDMQADAASGRRTFPVMYGTAASNRVYLAMLLAGFASVPLAVAVGALPLLSMISLLALPLSLVALRGARCYGEHLGQASQFMAANVAAALLGTSLLALSLALTN